MNVKQAVELLVEKGYKITRQNLPKIRVTRPVVARIKKLLAVNRRVVLVRKKTAITVFSLDGYQGRVAGGKRGGAARWAQAARSRKISQS